jgi:hypothetical protein
MTPIEQTATSTKIIAIVSPSGSRLVVALSSSAARQSAARARRDNRIKYLSSAWNVFPPDIKNADANSCHEGNQAKCFGTKR